MTALALAGLGCLGLLTAPTRLLAADVTLTASDPQFTSSFNSGLNWNDGLAPAPGNAYFTAGFLLRTPEITGDATFAGDSLSLDAGGTLAIKTFGLVTIAELILNGGLIDNFGGPGGISTEFPLAGAITVAAASTINGGTASGRAIDVRSTMTGPGRITIGGVSGTNVVYSGVGKAYAGGTTINSGSQLRMGVANALPSGSGRGTVTVGGQLNLNGFGTTVNALAGSGLVTSANAATLTIGAANTTGTFGGQITGSVAVVKTGTGVLTLSNANNTFTGGLTIAAGRVAVGNTNALGPVNSQITVASGAALDVNGGFTANTRNYNITIAGTGTDGAGAIFNNGTGSTAGFKTLSLAANATIGGTGRFDVRPATAREGRLNLGGFTLTKSDTNIVSIVDSEATEDGSINVTGGVLGLTRTTVTGAGAINVSGGAELYLENNNSNPLPTITKAINLANGATLRNVGAASGFTVGSVVSLAGTTTWNTLGNPLAMTGIISGAGRLVKTNTGTLTLSAANTFTGGTTVTDGTLTLSGGADRLATTGGITISGGSLNLGGNGQTTSGFVTLGGGTVSNGTLTSTTLDFGGTAGSVLAVLAGGVGLTKTSDGTLTLSAANTFTGGTTITAGTLALTGGNDRLATTGVITVTGGSLNLGGTSQATSGGVAITGGSIGNGTLSKTGGMFTADAGGISAVLAGTAGLAKVGSGTLVLSAASTFSGGTTIAGGTLRLDFAAAGAPAADILPAAGVVTLSGGSLDLVGVVSGTTSQSLGGLVLASDESVTVAAASGATGSANLALGPITRTAQGGVNFTLPASGSITTTTANTGGILGPWATVGGEGWAVSAGDGTNPGAITALASYVDDTWAPGNATTVTGDSAPAADAETGSLRFADPVAATVTLAGTNTIISGGLLVASTVGVNASTLSGGTLRGAVGGELMIQQFNSAGPLVIGSAIVDNTSATALVKSGPGTAVLAAAATHTGGTIVAGGTLAIGAGGTTGSLVGDVTNNGTVAFDRSDAVSWGHVISGVGSVIQQGTGALTLAAAQTYAGGTTVAAGTLALGGTDFLPTGTTVTFADAAGATLDLAGRSQEVFALTGGGTTGGAVANSSGTASVLTLRRTEGNISYAGSIDGNIRLEVRGGTPLDRNIRQVLTSTTSTYTGGTLVDNGALLPSAGRALGEVPGSLDAANVTLQNGGLLVFGISGSTSLSPTRGITLGSGGGGLEVGFNSAYTATIAGPIAGAAGNTLTIVGDSGLVVLSGANTYAGDTIIMGSITGSPIGRLQIGAGGTTGTFGTGNVVNDGQLTINRSNAYAYGGTISGPGTLIKQAAGAFTLTGAKTGAGLTEIQGGSLQIGSGGTTGSLAGDVNTTATTALLAFNRSDDLTYAGAVSGSGSLTKTGAGTLTLSAASTYSGTTTITAGTIRLVGGADRLGTTALLSIANAAGATLDLAGNDQRVNGLLGGGETGGRVVNSGGTTSVLTLAAGTDRSYSGTIEGATRVVVAGTSNLTSQPRQRLLNEANTYTGGTVVSGNALLVRADRSFGAVPAALDPVNITLQNAGLFFNDSAAVSLNANRGIRIGPGGGGMMAGFNVDVTINGPISGDAANSLRILANNGTVIWTDTNTFAGQLVVSGTSGANTGRLQIGTGGTTGTLGTGPVEIQTDGFIRFNRAGQLVVANVVAGGGTIIKEGTGTLVLSGNNSFGSGTFTYDGGVSQDRGAIRLASETALGNFTTINLTGDSAAKRQIQLTGGNAYAYSITTSGLSNPQADGAALVNVDGGNIWNGDISIAAGGGAYGIRSDSGTLTINGAVQRTLSSNDTRNWQIGGAGDVVVNGAVQVVAAQGVMGLDKFGSGTLTLANAANTYSGATNVAAGTLLVNGSLLSTASMTIAAGATLGGSGRIATTIAGAGLVSPGNSPGITTANAVNPTAGTSYAFEFTALGSPDYGTAAASINDVLRLTAATPFTASLVAANVIDVYFDVAALGGGDTFRGGFYTDVGSDFLPSIASATYAYWVRGDNSGSDRVFNGQSYYTLANFGAGLSVTVSTVAESANFGAGPVNGQVSQFVIVPEPGTLGLIALAAAGAGAVIRKRHHAASR